MSQNDWDTPGILAHVPDVSQLTQKSIVGIFIDLELRVAMIATLVQKILVHVYKVGVDHPIRDLD